MMGLEPTAFGTTTRRSNQLSYIRRKTEVIIAEILPHYNLKTSDGGAQNVTLKRKLFVAIAPESC